jgi:hypothetical protein
MGSEGRHGIKAAKLRLAVARMQESAASQTVKSATEVLASSSGANQDRRPRIGTYDQAPIQHESAKPTSWQYSQAKKDLTKELEDPTSAFRNMSINQIHKSNPKYSCYHYPNFYNNVSRLAKKLDVTLPKSKKGGKRNDSEANKKVSRGDTNDTRNDADNKRKNGWKASTAKSVLFELLLDENSYIHRQTNDHVYESHPCFQEFDPKYFKKHLKTLRKLAKETLKLIAKEEEDYQQDLLRFPRTSMTSGGYPHWDTHQSSVLLHDDVKSGLASTLKPAELRARRIEYQDFPPNVFRGHIYQEKRHQKEGDYWIPKRNKEAQKKRDDEVQKMKGDWEENQFDEDIREICRQIEQSKLDE